MWSRYYAAARLSLLALATVTVSIGVAPSERGYVSFQFDCNRANLDDEKTSDAVTVEFYSDNSLVGAVTSWPHCGKTSDAFYGVVVPQEGDAYDVDYVVVRANGRDALYIDQACMGDDVSDSAKCIPELPRWGVDSTKGPDVKGWCLSQDSNDAGDWSEYVMGERCYSCLKFDTDGDTVSTPGLDKPYLDERAVSSCE